GNVAPVEFDRAAIRAAQSGDGLRKLDLAVAVNARDPEDFAAAHLEAQRRKAGYGKIMHREPHRAGYARHRLVWARDIAPHHHLGEPGTVRPGRRHAPCYASIAQHNDVVAEFQHLRQLMTDEYDALPLRAQPAEDFQ